MGINLAGPINVDQLQNIITQGFMDWRKLLGAEKVTNGTFTGAATGWTLNTGWTYNANAVDRDGAGTATMEQDVSAVVGEIYRVEYTISAYTDGSVTVTLGGTAGTARSSAATFVEYIKAATTGNLIFTPAADATFTIDTVSVKKVGYVATDGVAAWVEDRGATAGKGALHLLTEDGTGHVFGDRVGIGTLYPTAAFNVAVAAVFDSTLLIGTATAYVAGQLEVNKSNGAVITGLNTWNDADTPGISYHNKALNDTIGTYTAITTGHLVHRDIYQGADGTDFQPLGEQEWSVTGTVGADRVAGKYILYLYTNAASSVKTAVWTITATGIVLGSMTNGFSMGSNDLYGLRYLSANGANGSLVDWRTQNGAGNLQIVAESYSAITIANSILALYAQAAIPTTDGAGNTAILPAGFLWIKFNAGGTAVLYVNDAGTIKSLSLGTPA